MSSTTTDRRLGLTGSAAIKVPCKAATTANITLSAAQTIDGVSCVTGDRVLVKSQTSSVDNGIYVVDTGTWTRDLDFDGVSDVVTGTIVMVLNGSTNANTYWRLATTGTVTFGTSAITFAAALAGDSAMVTFLPSGTGAVATDLQSRGRLVVYITDYMTAAQKADALLADPVLDHASAMSFAIRKIMGTQGAVNTRGGEIYIPAGLCIRLATDPFGVLPNDGTTGERPAQASLRIYGAGGGGAQYIGGAAAGTSTGGSQIDFRYMTANNAKIDTRGLGVLEIDHLTLKDTSGNSEPFIHTTNTVVLTHHNEVLGSKSGALADQDFIIFGGTSTALDETANAAFQGYGSQVYENQFHKIRRATYCRMYANGVPIHHNTIFSDCGFSTGAPFVYDGDPLTEPPVQSIGGAPCHHNLVEMVSYKYGVMFRSVFSSTAGPNDFYDPTATTTAYYFFKQSTFNTVLGGFHSDVKPFVVEDATAPTSVNKNTWHNGHQAQDSVYAGANPRFKNGIQIDNVALGTAGTPIIGVIAAKASLDFTAIAAQTSEEFSITVTGARQGDMVAIGMLNAQATLGGAAPTTFFAWVITNDTVRIRRSNVGTVAAADPAAGDVGVVVFKMNI